MDKHTLGNRLMYGAAAIAAVFAVVMLDAYIAVEYGRGRFGSLLSHGSVIPLLFGVLAVGGALELCRLMRAAGLRPQTLWATFCSGLLAVSPWLISGWVLALTSADLDGYQWLLTVLAFALGGTVFGALRRKEMSGAIADIGATWTVIIYTGLLAAFAVQIRAHSYLHGAEGAWLVLIFVLVVKVSDIGAWTTGLLIGRHKLIPWVSPKKTIEGAMGGMAFSALVALVFWQAHAWTEPELAPTSVRADPSGGDIVKTTVELGVRSGVLLHEMSRNFASLRLWWQPVVFGLLMSIVGQAGDLLESCFKRAAGAKDSAALLPAFGGILDIIDSPLLAAPVAWFVLTCWWPVV